MKAFLVLTTAPGLAPARKLSRAILEKRLAACVHIAPAGESLYWWKGALEKAREQTLIFKTSKKALPSFMRTLKQLHPYETPEILAIPVAGGDPDYLEWLQKETQIPH